MISSDTGASFCVSASFASASFCCSDSDDEDDDDSFCSDPDPGPDPGEDDVDSLEDDVDSFDSDEEDGGGGGVRSIKELSLEVRDKIDCVSGAEATNISGRFSSFSFCLSESACLDSPAPSVAFLRRGGGGGGVA